MDPSTKRIFVGGVNHLYDIGFDEADNRLRERNHVVTGPEDDSVECRGWFSGAYLVYVPLSVTV